MTGYTDNGIIQSFDSLGIIGMCALHEQVQKEEPKGNHDVTQGAFNLAFQAAKTAVLFPVIPVSFWRCAPYPAGVIPHEDGSKLV